MLPQRPHCAVASVGEVTAQLRRRPPLVFAGRGLTTTHLDGRRRAASFRRWAKELRGAFAGATTRPHAAQDRATRAWPSCHGLRSVRCPSSKVGVAGQYAKPGRPTRRRETGDSSQLPGGVRNSIEFIDAQWPDRRLLSLYNHAASTLNLIRAFTKGGCADLRQVHHAGIRGSCPTRCARHRTFTGPSKFMGAAGVDFETLRRDLYSLTEAPPGYESAMTRIDSRTGLNLLRSHFLWAGERPPAESAHIELLTVSCATPSAVKQAPRPRPSRCVRLSTVNPDGEDGA